MRGGRGKFLNYDLIKIVSEVHYGGEKEGV